VSDYQRILSACIAGLVKVVRSADYLLLGFTCQERDLTVTSSQGSEGECEIGKLPHVNGSDTGTVPSHGVPGFPRDSPLLSGQGTLNVL
jgi:hypothetical protein